MKCICDGCESMLTDSRVVLCEAHWRVLPRWARSELVRLRNASRRGSKAAARDFAKAAMVAARMALGASAPPSASTGPTAA